MSSGLWPGVPVGMLGAGIVSEVFDARGQGLPLFDLALCTDRPGTVPTDVGLPLVVEHGLDRLATADLVIALPWADFRTPPAPAVLDALTTAHARGALVAGHCVGAFALAAAGLLDGRRATTHWRFARLLAERYPAVAVEPDALYVDEGRIATGAGAAAGFDLCLHLLRREYGAATGTTPHAWLLGLRLARAEELLETTDLPVEEIARAVGFGSAAVLRERFVRRRGVPPRSYRRSFSRVP